MGLSLSSGLCFCQVVAAHGAGSPDVLPLGRSSTRASRIRTLDQNGPNMTKWLRFLNSEIPKHTQTQKAKWVFDPDCIWLYLIVLPYGLEPSPRLPPALLQMDFLPWVTKWLNKLKGSQGHFSGIGAVFGLAFFGGCGRHQFFNLLGVFSLIFLFCVFVGGPNINPLLGSSRLIWVWCTVQISTPKDALLHL